MRRPRKSKIAPADALPLAASPPPAPTGPPWHRGRTFYACPCGCQDEHKGDDPPETVPCWGEKCSGTMRQWLPPVVKRDREAGRV